MAADHFQASVSLYHAVAVLFLQFNPVRMTEAATPGTTANASVLCVIFVVIKRR
jgi:hypothetical protein